MGYQVYIPSTKNLPACVRIKNGTMVSISEAALRMARASREDKYTIYIDPSKSGVIGLAFGPNEMFANHTSGTSPLGRAIKDVCEAGKKTPPGKGVCLPVRAADLAPVTLEVVLWQPR